MKSPVIVEGALPQDLLDPRLVSRPKWSGKYIVLLIGLALFWAAENFLIQAAAFDEQPGSLHPLAFQAARFSLDLLAASTVVLLCNRRWALALIAGDFLVSVVTLPFAHYFHHALSIGSAMRTAGEGLRVSSFGLELVPIPVWLALLGALAVKIYWVIKITPQPAACRRRQERPGPSQSGLAFAPFGATGSGSGMCSLGAGDRLPIDNPYLPMPVLREGESNESDRTASN
jgi:hypothetical protein